MLPDTAERYLSTPLFEDIGVDMDEEELAISRSTPGCRFDVAPAAAPAPQVQPQQAVALDEGGGAVPSPGGEGARPDIDGGDAHYEGEVSLVSPKRNMEERSFDVHGHIESGEDVLKPGMYVEAEILLGADSLPAVPESAVVYHENAPFVITQKGGQFTLEQVRTGVKMDGWVEIKDPAAIEIVDGRGDVRLVYDLPQRALRFTAGDLRYPVVGYQTPLPAAGIPTFGYNTARHASTMLTFDAVAQALDEIAAKRAQAAE